MKTVKRYQTRCEVCGGIDGSVESSKRYNPKTDLAMWEKEGREYTLTEMKVGEKIDWCRCEMSDTTEE